MLRARLFLNLIPFVLILLGVGGYAIVLISRLARSVDVMVMANYRSAAAVRKISGAVKDMELGLQLAMEGSTNVGLSTFKENARVAETNLAILTINRHLFKKADVIEGLHTNYNAFRVAGISILALAQRPEQQPVLDKIFEDVRGRRLAIEEDSEKIDKANDKSILATTDNIQNDTRHIIHLMIAALAVAFLIYGFAGLQLSKSILRPSFADRLPRAKLAKAISTRSSRASTTNLANWPAFNKMAAQLKVFRQSTSEKIMRLHRTMESALASFPDPIFILDREGHIELKNPAAQNLSARLGLRDTLPHRLSDTAREVLRTSQDSLPHTFKDVISLRVDGAEQSFLPRILTMRGKEDVPVGVAVVLQDVTRFRLLDDAKTNLVATVSHEIKTPLTSVRMALHLLLEKTVGPLNPEQNDLLQMARKEAERLLCILNDLLDLTRLEAGQSALNKGALRPPTGAYRFG
jgi:signal transduction histidine kinase